MGVTKAFEDMVEWKQSGSGGHNKLKNLYRPTTEAGNAVAVRTGQTMVAETR